MSVSSSSNDGKYELLYWPAVTGRGLYVQLAFEAAGIPYYDTTNAEQGGIAKLIGIIRSTDTSDVPCLAPPILRVKSGTTSGNPILLSQTPNILQFLGENEGLAPKDDGKYLVHQYTLTALDLNNEAHDTHHPVGIGLYYEDQKPEALRKSKEVRQDRIPKFFGYFNRALKYNTDHGGSANYLVGNKLTYADTTLWGLIDGVSFAFPTRIEELKKAGEFKELFAFYENLKENELKSWVGSEKRIEHGKGVFRHYPELDVEQA